MLMILLDLAFRRGFQISIVYNDNKTFDCYGECTLVPPSDHNQNRNNHTNLLYLLISSTDPFSITVYPPLRAHLFHFCLYYFIFLMTQDTLMGCPHFDCLQNGHFYHKIKSFTHITILHQT